MTFGIGRGFAEVQILKKKSERSRFTNAYNWPCSLAINKTLLTPAAYFSACMSFLLSELALIFWIYAACLMI